LRPAEFLQLGTQAAFSIRFLLASTIGANYGIYGPAFELLESKPVRVGSEEYLDSEKYQIRNWDLGRKDSLRELIMLLNSIRRNNPALQNDWSIQFHPTDNEQLICYSKQSDDKTNTVLVVINLDPHHTQSGFITLHLDKIGFDVERPYQAHDLLTDARYLWHGQRNYVQLDPYSVPGHILRLRSRIRVESDFEYFL
jgi:starch synthase (maltosyl-transferring)